MSEFVKGFDGNDAARLPGSVVDSAGTWIFPEAWGITVVSSGADGPELTSTTDGVNTWTQTITYDGNGWPSFAAWVKS